MGKKKTTSTANNKKNNKITLSLAQFQTNMQYETDVLISEGYIEQSVPPYEDEEFFNHDDNEGEPSNMMMDTSPTTTTFENSNALAEAISQQEEEDMRLALALQEEEDRMYANVCAEREMTQYHPMRVVTDSHGSIQIGGGSGYDLQQRCNRANQLKVVLVHDEGRKGRRNTSNTLFDDYELEEDFSHLIDSDEDSEDGDDYLEDEEMTKFFKTFSQKELPSGSSSMEEEKPKENSVRLPKQEYITRVNLPSHVRTAIQTSERKEIEKKIKEGDKMADRATAENVLDKQTRMMLYKFRNNGTLDSINGCVSTGKEANVYHATSGEPFEGNVIHATSKSTSSVGSSSTDASNTLSETLSEQPQEQQPVENTSSTKPLNSDLAIKIYKTSALLFRDRDRYVSGDRRFKRGYSKTNPRKMVAVWAEKELRNLKRLENVGIRVPKVIALKKHILIMEFIGKNGWCAPRLKDAKIPSSKMKDVYLDIIKTMWTMYHKAKLIHADLSEYNMLYYNGTVYYIDVSQSVELDHPHGLEFLRKDCENIKNYFIRNGLTYREILTTKELFDFVTDVNISEEIVDSYLRKMFEKIQSRPITLNEEEKVQAEVFKKVHIPRSLIEIADPLDHQESIDTDDVFFYKSVTGINENLTGSTNIPYGLTEDELQELTANIPQTAEGEFEQDPIPTSSEQDPLDKKERKKMVKEQNREKRQNKTPKKVKKQLNKNPRNLKSLLNCK